MRQHPLADILKVDEIILGGDFVGVVHEESSVAARFRAQGIPIIVVRKRSVGSSLGGREEARLSEPTRNMVEWGR